MLIVSPLFPTIVTQRKAASISDMTEQEAWELDELLTKTTPGPIPEKLFLKLSPQASGR